MEIFFVDESDYKEASAQSDTGRRRWKKSRPSCFILELRAVLNIGVEDLRKVRVNTASVEARMTAIHKEAPALKVLPKT